MRSMTEQSQKTLRIYNTLSRSVEVFKPLNGSEVKLYCCGPTVYDFQHIGNMRTYIFEDLLVRTLRYAGYKVKHVMNITDVGHLVSDADQGEDKMAIAAKREKKSSLEIAKYYTDIFFQDCTKLNIIKPDVICKATDHISEMIDLIKRLEEREMVYSAGGNLYFDVSKLSDYGKLAKLDLEKLQAGARIEVDQNKRSPFDFVLWFTKSKFDNQELQWDSPWGRGYPGWHIECSAMSMKYLGDKFDIHCGGIDHIPVHHTNEIAQSEGATGKPWVNYWLHGEFLITDQGKMSKSKGGFLTLKTLEDDGYDPVVYRLLCLGAHYRTQLKFSQEALEGAKNSLKRLKNSVLQLKAELGNIALSQPSISELENFEAAIFDDLNAPRALATLWAVLDNTSYSAAQKLGILYHLDTVLGLGISDWRESVGEIPTEVAALIEQRKNARLNKEWKESDRLRDEIIRLGFSVEDTAKGMLVKKS